jgi:hypothetical protein
MATPADYTSDELAKIAGGVMVSGMAISMVDVGIVSTAIEAAALAKEVAGASKKYPNNSIIQGLFSQEAIEKAKAQPPAKIELKPEDLKPDTAVDTAIKAVNEALAILTVKATPEEVAEYKQFIYSAAERVAQAAGEGLFGTGATKVSSTEAAALAKLKASLGI